MNKKKYITIFLIILIIALNYYFKSINFFSLENIKANKNLLINFINKNLLSSIFIFSLIYILVVSLSLPGAAILSLTAGFLFPFPLSGLIVLTSATIGALINLLVCRYLLKDFFEQKFKKPMKKINQSIKKHGNNYLLTLRLIPLFPFFLINLAMGLTDISAIKFTIISFIGMIPGSLVYVYTGQSLSTINSTNDIISPNILISLILLGLFSLIPIVFKKLKKSKNF